jgi:hypothetical protein
MCETIMLLVIIIKGGYKIAEVLKKEIGVKHDK